MKIKEAFYMVRFTFFNRLIDGNSSSINLERERQRIFREMIESSVGLNFMHTRVRPINIFNNLTGPQSLNPNLVTDIAESKNYSSEIIRDLLRKIEGDKRHYTLGNQPI